MAMKHLNRVIDILYGLLVAFALCGFLIGKIDAAIMMVIIIAVCWVTGEIILRAMGGVMYFVLGLHKKKPDEDDA
jgi:hypothetical protein